MRFKKILRQFKVYRIEAWNQLKNKISMYDRGGEQSVKDFIKLCENSSGIVQK